MIFELTHTKPINQFIYTYIHTYICSYIYRLADGPDAVHLRTIAKEELKREVSEIAKQVSGTNKNIKKYGFFSGGKDKNRKHVRAIGMRSSRGVLNSSL